MRGERGVFMGSIEVVSPSTNDDQPVHQRTQRVHEAEKMRHLRITVGHWLPFFEVAR